VPTFLTIQKAIMITLKSLDINVAIIGNVSAGKSTLLNALLRAKYSEVSMKRTTAGINYFRLHKKKSTDSVLGGESEDANKLDPPSPDWKPAPASATLQQIAIDNGILRETDTIQEKYFDVELDECICSEIHPDVRLVLVDVPGINEAQTGAKYKDYLESKWRTFDAIIVVMDGKQGVNTDDQVNLLKLVQGYQSLRWQPVIILFNKVDDPEDEEQADMIAEASKEVERIFQVGDRCNALNSLLQPSTSDKISIKSHLPAFLPFSASHAYFHQTVSLLSFDEFQKYDDKDLIEKYGREYIGRAKWKKLTNQQKVKAVYEIVNDPEMRQEGMEISNLVRLLQVFDKCVGGVETQMDLIIDRLDSTLQSITVGTTGMTLQLAELYKSYKFLATSTKAEKILVDGTKQMTSWFWDQLRSYQDQAVDLFRQEPMSVNELASVVTELELFRDFVKCFPEDQKLAAEAKIKRKMEWLIKSYLEILIRQGKTYQQEPAKKKGLEWEFLSAEDWVNLWGSVLLVASDRHFVNTFGVEKLQIDALMHDARNMGDNRLDGIHGCVNCKGAYSVFSGLRWCGRCLVAPVFSLRQEGKMLDICAVCRGEVDSTSGICKVSGCGSLHRMKIDKMFYCQWSDTVKANKECSKCGNGGCSEVSRRKVYCGIPIAVPRSLANPDHFGHLLWRYCEFMRTLEETKKRKFLGC
jgi:small GTP-binding protein